MQHHLSHEFPPHAVCWLWDVRLILLHGVSSLLTAIAYLTIPLIVLYIYRQGRVKGLVAAYPMLWLLGGGFVFLCGLSHLGDFLEIWYGGLTYWITGICKAAMSIVSLAFAYTFWLKSGEIVLIAKILFELSNQDKRG